MMRHWLRRGVRAALDAALEPFRAAYQAGQDAGTRHAEWLERRRLERRRRGGAA